MTKLTLIERIATIEMISEINLNCQTITGLSLAQKFSRETGKWYGTQIFSYYLDQLSREKFVDLVGHKNRLSIYKLAFDR